jgi:hypothetical protein
VLALVGRLEPRDWLDVIACHERMQPLGLLAWAAVGKDPGFTPAGLLAHARRSSRYTQADVDALDFLGDTPSASQLAAEWRTALEEAETIVAAIPVDRVGSAVLDRDGRPLRGSVRAISDAVTAGDVLFHAGCIGGAWPAVRTV